MKYVPRMCGDIHHLTCSAHATCAHARRHSPLESLRACDACTSLTRSNSIVKLLRACARVTCAEQLCSRITPCMCTRRMCGDIHPSNRSAHELRCSAHVTRAHVQKRSCLYLTARQRYQLISTDLCFSDRSNARDARDYFCQMYDRTCALRVCAEEILSLSDCQPWISADHCNYFFESQIE